MRALVFLVLSFFLCAAIYAQSVSDSLRICVFDAKSKQPLPAVVILYQGHGAIGLTDSFGNAVVAWRHFTEDLQLELIEACHLSKNIRVGYGAPNLNVYLKPEKCY